MYRILLVDDERLPMEYYVRAFRSKKFEVIQCFDPDKALNLIEKKGDSFDAIILDIMMLPGERYKQEDTNEGLRTGIFLYKDIRAGCPNTPIVMLTNVSKPEITKIPEETSDTFVIIQKIDYPPFELVDLVEKIIAKQKSGCDEK